MSEILHIQGQRVDITPRTVSRKLQINDIGDAKYRQTSFSNTIKLPRTSTNVQVFSFLGINGNNSLAPYRKLRCDYSVNGIPLIRNGYAVVKAANSHYEVVIYDGTIDLAERLKGKKLSDLNFSDLNHYLTQAVYQSSLQNTEGYIYALGEFIARPYFNTVQISEQAPSIFVKTLWDKVFTEAGLDYSGTFFEENTDFLSEVIGPAKGYDVENVDLTSTSLGSSDSNVISHNVYTSDPMLSFTDVWQFTGTAQMVMPNAGQYTLDLSINYSNSDSHVVVYVKLDGRTISSMILERNGSSLEKVINFSAEGGEALSIEVRGTYHYDQVDGSNEDPNSIDGKYSVNYSASSSIQLSENTGGQFIDFASFTSDMDQLAFVKDIMQRYGLILKPVRDYSGYHFIQFEELLNDRAGAEDWSGKLNRVIGEGYSTKYAKRNFATYSYPEEIVDRLYDGEMTVDNENADAEKNLFTAPYQIPTRRSREFNNQVIYKNTIWEEKEEDGETIIANKETPVKIFRIERQDTSISTRFFDSANTVGVSGNIPFLSLRNMQMQYFLNRYYKAYRSLVERIKQVDAELLLNEIDIYNLDFFKLKYFKQTGKFYYLNNVKHVPGKLNKAELIQLNKFSVNMPPTVLGVYSRTLTYENSAGITVENITEQSNPAYFDPEFDEPMAIMITGGFNNDILIKNGTQVLNTETEILVENWNLIIQDTGNTLDEHSANFTFKIKDKGSGKLSEVEGTIAITVNEYINNPPVANAGADQNVQIPTNEYSTIASLDGSGSSDATGEITQYNWIIISKPATSTATISNPQNMNSALSLPNSSDSYGDYTIELKVTDEFGATDTDTVVISVTASSIQPT